MSERTLQNAKKRTALPYCGAKPNYAIVPGLNPVREGGNSDEAKPEDLFGRMTFIFLQQETQNRFAPPHEQAREALFVRFFICAKGAIAAVTLFANKTKKKRKGIFL